MHGLAKQPQFPDSCGTRGDEDSVSFYTSGTFLAVLCNDNAWTSKWVDIILTACCMFLRHWWVFCTILPYSIQVELDISAHQYISFAYQGTFPNIGKILRLHSWLFSQWQFSSAESETISPGIVLAWTFTFIPVSRRFLKQPALIVDIWTYSVDALLLFAKSHRAKILWKLIQKFPSASGMPNFKQKPWQR